MKKLAVTMLALAIQGCITWSGGVAPSNKPIDPEDYVVIDRVSGSSWGVNILGFLQVAKADTEEAMNEAETAVASDGLIRITVNNTGYWFLIINLQEIEVEALAVRNRD